MSDDRAAHDVAALVGLRHWEEALATVDRLLAADPGDGHSWCQRAAVLICAGRHPEALVAADRAAGLLPDVELPQRLRALALRGAGRRKPALVAARQGAALAPDSSTRSGCWPIASSAPDARRGRGDRPPHGGDGAGLGARVGDARHRPARPAPQAEEAIDAYRAALRLEPSSAVAMNGLGAALLADHRRDEAAEHFAQAARTDPHDVTARSNLELVTAVGGMFAIIGLFRIIVEYVEGPARVVVAIYLLLAGVGLVVGLREERTRRLPADAERYVRAPARSPPQDRRSTFMAALDRRSPDTVRPRRRSRRTRHGPRCTRPPGAVSAACPGPVRHVDGGGRRLYIFSPGKLAACSIHETS